MRGVWTPVKCKGGGSRIGQESIHWRFIKSSPQGASEHIRGVLHWAQITSPRTPALSLLVGATKGGCGLILVTVSNPKGGTATGSQALHSKEQQVLSKRESPAVSSTCACHTWVLFTSPQLLLVQDGKSYCPLLGAMLATNQSLLEFFSGPLWGQCFWKSKNQKWVLFSVLTL